MLLDVAWKYYLFSLQIIYIQISIENSEEKKILKKGNSLFNVSASDPIQNELKH